MQEGNICDCGHPMVEQDHSFMCPRCGAIEEIIYDDEEEVDEESDSYEMAFGNSKRKVSVSCPARQHVRGGERNKRARPRNSKAVLRDEGETTQRTNQGGKRMWMC